MGLEAYNALPTRCAVHAIYECCHSVVLATDLAATSGACCAHRAERMLGPEGGYYNW